MIESAQRFRETCQKARGSGALVGFVPTMGALHRGHIRLIGQAREECGFVTISIFVNPLQFTSHEDFATYPRTIEQDRAVAVSLGVDVAFVPEEGEMYPGGRPEVAIDPGPLGDRLEGVSRPGHFRGVLTVVAKLFNLVGPCRAYFGEKDSQQLALVRRMVAGLSFPVRVVACPIVRDPDGLALSSRNSRLSDGQRRAAPVLFEGLSDAATRSRLGERSADVLKAEIARRIGGEPQAKLDYVAIVDEGTWEEVRSIHGPARALVAAYFGEVRLIDNVALPWEPGSGVQNTQSS
ncbi:MAG: pantoate--beta-alanine ligase [Actinomycetota bacterium]